MHFELCHSRSKRATAQPSRPTSECALGYIWQHTQQQLEQELGAKLVNRCILLWTATACSTDCGCCVHSIGLLCFPNTARLPACYSLSCSWCVCTLSNCNCISSCYCQSCNWKQFALYYRYIILP